MIVRGDSSFSEHIEEITLDEGYRVSLPFLEF